MDGCIYRTKDGECDLYTEKGKYKAYCVDGPCESCKPSNADRIRSMSDEELANYFFNSAIYHAATTSPIPPLEEWFEWLRKKVEDGHTE